MMAAQVSLLFSKTRAQRVESELPSSDPPPPTGEPRWFTVFDLAHLLIRDGTIAGCAVTAWCLGQRFAAVTGASPTRAFLDQMLFTAMSLPVGWLAGWVLRAAFALLLALVFKALIGGRIWGQGGEAEPGAAPDRG